MEFANGDKITSIGVGTTELIFKSPMKGQAETIIAYIQILSAVSGIQFSSGAGQINSNSHLWQAGDSFPISFSPGIQNIYFKSLNAGDSFVITV